MKIVLMIIRRLIKYFSYFISTLVLLIGLLIYLSVKDTSFLDWKSSKQQRKLDIQANYYKWWTDRPAVFKITDRVILAIPPQFQEFWRQRDQVDRMPMALEDLHQSKDQIMFSMFMPDFHGFTPENFFTTWHKDRVNVYVIYPLANEGEPGAPGQHTPNLMESYTAQPQPRIDPERYEEIHGLRCFVKLTRSNYQHCLGQRRSGPDEWLLLDALPEAKLSEDPLMRTRYYSSQFGGLNVEWRASMKHFSHWKEIDQQIWKYLEAWNIAPQQ